MKTATERTYELEHNLLFTATVERTHETFRYGFVDDKTATTQERENIHGFWGGSTRRIIETVDRPDIKSQDKINLGSFGFAKVVETYPVWLNPDELKFVPSSIVSRVTRITLTGAGSANV